MAVTVFRAVRTQGSRALVFEICPDYQGKVIVRGEVPIATEPSCNCPRGENGTMFPSHETFSFASTPPEGDERTLQQWAEACMLEAYRLVSAGIHALDEENLFALDQ